MGWQARAVCRDKGLVIEWLTLDELAQVADCARCPVRQECLADAITNRATGVVRGGVVIGGRPLRPAARNAA